MESRKRRQGQEIQGTRREYRSQRRVSATEASRNFSDILNRALYRGESFIIERGGEPVCEIRPAASSSFKVTDLVVLLRDLPSIDEEFLNTVQEISRSQPSVPGSPWEP